LKLTGQKVWMLRESDFLGLLERKWFKVMRFAVFMRSMDGTICRQSKAYSYDPINDSIAIFQRINLF